MKRLSAIIEKLNKAIEDEFNSYPDNDWVEACIIHNDRYDINVCMDSDGGVEVSIINTDDCDKSYPNIEQYIAGNINEWDNLKSYDYDEWDDHGFSSESDYLRYKYG